ncbi:hypothetical protein [Bacillus licheniformis]|uniref:hypothetical protein n=1 Tax=Bacillus licheniformis TaxID=1402 RepID=UPI002E1DAC9E|nr:hypothetical protein [Bacillus licheniformis]
MSKARKLFDLWIEVKGVVERMAEAGCLESGCFKMEKLAQEIEQELIAAGNIHWMKLQLERAMYDVKKYEEQGIESLDFLEFEQMKAYENIALR